MRGPWRHLTDWYDRYLFEGCSVGTCVVLRVAFGIAVTIYAVVWWLDGPFWFADSGVMTVHTAQQLTLGQQWSPLFLVDATPELVNWCLGIFIINAVLLLLGVWSRLQAALIFFWLVTFQARNPLILDGEDTVFRLFAFYMIWMPLDARWSLWAWWRARQPAALSQMRAAAWPLRLVQLQMCFLYLSAAWSKWLGEPWRDGSALYYVFQMVDVFGRGWFPQALLQSEMVIRGGTWGVLLVESLLPVLLLCRRTRILGVALGVALHGLIEYSMHLFLFQWIMMIGLLAFLNLDRWVESMSPTRLSASPDAVTAG